LLIHLNKIFTKFRQFSIKINQMKKIERGEYVSPKAEILDLNIERGFAESGPASGDGTLLDFTDGGNF